MITTEKVSLTPDQESARDAIVEFVKSKDLLLTMGGYAGTGKTMTISYSIKHLKEIKKFSKIRIAFVCFTGKAATVLKDKLVKADALGGADYCGTIHGLIYRPEYDDQGRLEWIRQAMLEFDIIVIDEASMVSDTIFDDLKSYGIPILAVGDHGQLPPIASKYNLMENPMIRLEKIHRQAEGNPIIHTSMLARTGEEIPFSHVSSGKGESVLKTDTPPLEILKVQGQRIPSWMILCAMNRTRVEVNRSIRKILGREGILTADEKVICLKNNRKQKIFNGMVGLVKTYREGRQTDFLSVGIDFELMNFQWRGQIFKHQFNNERTLKSWEGYMPEDVRELFDYGYCMTVHKSQGSQAEIVLMIEERMPTMSDDNWNRWLYTGITRASKNLVICGRK